MIRVAFLGKGGAGKSTIAGTFARLLARRDEPVLALDSDPLPGLSYALGIEVDDQPIPDDAVVEGPDDGPRFVLAPGLDPDQIINRYAVLGPDGVRYLQFGNTRGHISTIQRAQFAWTATVAGLDNAAWHLVGDLPGGTRQAMFGWAKYAECVLLVVEPTAKSLHSAKRLLRMAEAEWGPKRFAIVANKVQTDGDISRIASRLDRPVDGAVPLSHSIVAGDRLGSAPLDADPSGPFVEAVEALVEQVSALYDEPEEAV